MAPFKFHIPLLSAVLVVLPLATRAQPAPVDTAEVMLGAVETLRARGETENAEWLLDLIRRLYPNSRAARLAGEMQASERRSSDAGGGKTEFVVWSTFYGAWLGVIIPAAFDANGPEPYGVGLLVGAPIGYGLSTAYARRHPVSPGQARAMTFGSWWGTLQALGWREVFHIGDQTGRVCNDFGEGSECFDYRTESDAAPFTAMVIGGLTGMAVGTLVGRTRPITASTALVTNLGAVWGGWFGAVLGEQIDRDDYRFQDDSEDETMLTTALIGGNVGLLAGALGGPSLRWTTGQAWIVHLAGIAGLIGGLGIDLLASVESDETGLLIPGLTSAASLGVAAALISEKRPTARVGPGLGSSLLDFASGRWRLGVPTPGPTAIPVFKDGRRHYEPGARVSILRMSW